LLRQDDYIKSHLVLTGWRWGKEYGGHLAPCMVMCCLANRVRLGWGTWLEVLDRVPQYAAQTEVPSGTPSIWEPGFVRLLHEVDAIYDGSSTDYSNGGLYWADLRRIDTEFFKQKILGNPTQHPRVADMNSLTIFR
jgi:hypothetical protein